MLIRHIAYVPPYKGHSREMGTVSQTQDIFTPVKQLESSVNSQNLFCSELQRLVTFLNWDTQTYGALQSLLAKAGFFYTGKEDTVECFACGVQLSDWHAAKDPVKEHAAVSPTCLYKNLNVPLSSSSKDSIKSFSLDIFELPESKPVQDFPTKPQLTEEWTMQCDVRSQGANNNPIQGGGLQSLPAIKNSLPSNVSYRRFVSCDGEDTPDMFSIADPAEHCAHPKIDLLRDELCRIQTFRNWPSNAPVTAAELARSGFFYVGPVDRVQCAFCRGILRNWAPGDSAMDEHHRHFPKCGFISGAQVGNIPLPKPGDSGYPASMSLEQGRKLDVTNNDADMYEETGIIENEPKHPEYAVKSVRLNTFRAWPRKASQKPEVLAECGFYCLGIDDSVKCFFCDGGLRSWEPSDDPWVEHARWFKKCGYLRQKKGQAFIQDINQRFPAYPVSAPEIEPVEPMETSSPENDVVSSLPAGNETPEDAEVRKQLQRPEFKETFSMGFTQQQISQAIRLQYRQYGKPFANSQELIEAILASQDDSSSSSSDSEENKVEKPSSTVESSTVEVQEPTKEKLNESAGQSTSQPVSSPPPRKKEKKKKRKKAEEGPTDSRFLEEQIRVLKEERVCKVCLDEAISIVFLPCGHMVCCGTCAPALRVCPICRENIKGNVKAYIS